MLDTFTLDKLILLAYNELNDENTLEMQALIATDEKVRKEWFEIKKSIDTLESKYAKPSESSIQRILEQSKNSNSLKTS